MRLRKPERYVDISNNGKFSSVSPRRQLNEPELCNHGIDAMRKAMLAVASHAGPISNGNRLSDEHAISALAALAQLTRLAIFRLDQARADRYHRRCDRRHCRYASQYPFVSPGDSGPGRPAAQLARRPHDHLSLGRGRHAVVVVLSGQRLLRRASRIVQSPRHVCGMLRACTGQNRLASKADVRPAKRGR